MNLDNPQVPFELIPDNDDATGMRVYLKSIAWVPFVLIVVIFIGAIFLAIISPRLKVSEFNKSFQENPQTRQKDNFIYDSSIFKLKKHEAFLKSRLAKSGLDSISVSINIPDSILSLDIKGVAIYNVKIDYCNLSPIFKSLDKKALINCFSSPFVIKYQYATVVKEPIIIKQAPRDTIEANQAAPDIDTLKPRMVAYFFYLDKDFVLDIRQSEPAEIIPYIGYSIKYKYWYTARQIKEISHMHLPYYLPWIQIRINCKDALAIYRSLPQQASISIHL